MTIYFLSVRVQGKLELDNIPFLLLSGLSSGELKVYVTNRGRSVAIHDGM
jgi:hypothetical protein